MNHVVRLQFIGRAMYYIGWIALLCGGLFHLNIATRVFIAMSLSKRNLFEVAVICFLICIASEIRAAHVGPAEVVPISVTKAA